MEKELLTVVEIEIVNREVLFGRTDSGESVFFDPPATRAVKKLGRIGQTITVLAILCPNPQVERRSATPHAVIGREAVHGLAGDEGKSVPPATTPTATTVVEDGTEPTTLGAALAGALPEIGENAKPKQEKVLSMEEVAGMLADTFKPVIAAIKLLPDEIIQVERMVGERFPRAVFDEGENQSAHKMRDRIIEQIRERRLMVFGQFLRQLGDFCLANMALQLGILAGEMPTLDQKGNPIWDCTIDELLSLVPEVEVDGLHLVENHEAPDSGDDQVAECQPTGTGGTH